MKMKIGKHELTNKINNEKKGNYIKLSEFYGGDEEAGFDGIIVNLDTLDVFEYSSKAKFKQTIFNHTKVITNNTINQIGKINEQGKKCLKDYINNNDIFKHKKLKNTMVLDAETKIEIKFDNISTELINCDKLLGRNTNYYDVLLAMIKEFTENNK